MLLLALTLTRPCPNRWPGLSRAVGTLMLLVIAANLLRTIDDAAASAADKGAQVGLIIVAVVALVAVAGKTAAGWNGYPVGFIAFAAAALLCGLLFASGSSDQLTASSW